MLQHKAHGSLHLTLAVRQFHLCKWQLPQLPATHLPCHIQRKRMDHSTRVGQKVPVSLGVLCDQQDLVVPEVLVVLDCQCDFLQEGLCGRGA